MKYSVNYAVALLVIVLVTISWHTGSFYSLSSLYGSPYSLNAMGKWSILITGLLFSAFLIIVIRDQSNDKWVSKILFIGAVIGLGITQIAGTH